MYEVTVDSGISEKTYHFTDQDEMLDFVRICVDTGDLVTVFLKAI